MKSGILKQGIKESLFQLCLSRLAGYKVGEGTNEQHRDMESCRPQKWIDNILDKNKK